MGRTLVAGSTRPGGRSATRRLVRLDRRDDFVRRLARRGRIERRLGDGDPARHHEATVAGERRELVQRDRRLEVGQAGHDRERERHRRDGGRAGRRGRGRRWGSGSGTVMASERGSSRKRAAPGRWPGRRLGSVRGSASRYPRRSERRHGHARPRPPGFRAPLHPPHPPCAGRRARAGRRAAHLPAGRSLAGRRHRSASGLSPRRYLHGPVRLRQLEHDARGLAPARPRGLCAARPGADLRGGNRRRRPDPGGGRGRPARPGCGSGQERHADQRHQRVPELQGPGGIVQRLGRV